MAGIPSLRSKIDLANAAGPASWGGSNGIEAQHIEIADLLQERGVKVVENHNTLSSLTGADAGLVLVKGAALYAFNPFGFTTDPLDWPANGGGRWQHIAAVGPTTYEKQIGNSIATSFTINHNLETLSPVIVQWEIVNGLPYTQSTAGTVTVVDENNVLIAYPTPPGSYQYLIGVKK